MARLVRFHGADVCERVVLKLGEPRRVLSGQLPRVWGKCKQHLFTSTNQDKGHDPCIQKSAQPRLVYNTMRLDWNSGDR